MGTKIFDLVPKQDITIEELKNKSIVVDTSLYLYQFMATIRQRDGTLLTDSNGNVTSHLIGLFARITQLMQNDIKLSFCFDGKPPQLKSDEQKRRREIKTKATEEYEVAKEREDVGAMKKFASRTSRLTKDMIDESKELLIALGLPVVQAPSEGEAQAAYLVKNNDAFGLSTNDADSLLFGTPRLIKDLSVGQKRKLPGKSAYVTTYPQLIELEKTLKHLNISQDQLIAIAMLVGTDYNYGGIKGLGPQKALKLVKQEQDLNKIFKEAKWNDNFDFEWEKIFNAIKNMPVEKNYDLKWTSVNPEKVKKILCDNHNFEENRVDLTLARLLPKKQQGLSQFF